jgi:hypothetical protein
VSEGELQGGLFRLPAMGNQASQDIDNEIERTTMARVLNLGDVLELVDAPFPVR